MNKWTTIRIKLSTKKRLNKLKVTPRESYNSVIKRLIMIAVNEKRTPETDTILWDMLHPAHSKIKVTKKLLDKLEDEQWSGK